MLKNSVNTRKIPICEPSIGSKEIEYVNDAVSSGWVSSSGKYVVEFENSFSEKPMIIFLYNLLR